LIKLFDKKVILSVNLHYIITDINKGKENLIKQIELN